VTQSPLDPAQDDSSVREQATDPARSVLLQAPAGSGKTTVLIQRFLRLLAVVDAPEQILAITFTRKAAGEMRARIMAALQIGQPPRDALEARNQALAHAALERSKQLGWQLEHNPGRLRIQTLDALNQRLAASLPVAARLGGSIETTDDAKPLYARAARLALRHAEQDPTLQRLSGLWLERVGNDWQRLEALLAELLARRNHWLRHVSAQSPQWLRARVEASVEALVRDEVAAIESSCDSAWLQEGQRLLQQALAALLAESRMPPPTWREVGVPGAAAGTAERLQQMRALATLGLTEKDEARRTLDVRLGFNARSDAKQQGLAWLETLASAPQCIDALRRARQLPDPALTATDGEALEALVVLLQYSAAQLLVVFAEHDQCDHAAMSAAARQALGIGDDSAPAALAEVELVHHVLVDEFQDTSIEQFELLRGLVAPWQQGEPRSLFLVGDPMQSIYQFREAEVALFIRARDRGIGQWRLEPMALRRNFRSAPTVVEFVNTTFTRVFPAVEDRREGAVRYHGSVAAGGQGNLPAGVHLHRIAAGDRAAEAQLVLEQIHLARASAPDASIAILVAGRAHARHITAVLRSAGVPVRGVELVPLRDVPVVQDLIALTRAILSPSDRIAWLAVLRAPWCGIALPALTDWVEADPAATIPSRLLALPESPLADTELRRLQRVAGVWRRVAACGDAATLAARVEAAWLQLGGPLCAVRSTDAADTDAFFVALRQAEQRAAIADAAAVERVVERLFATAGDAAGSVDVMTIHRSKGLEFDCVILPGLARSASHDRDPLLDWFEWSPAGAQPELVLAPVRAASEPPSRLAAWLQRLRRRRREHERARLLYVATTRARRALHMVFETPAVRADGSDGAPRTGTAQATLWPALRELALAAPERTRTTAAAPGGQPAMLRRLPADWQAPQWPAPIGARTATAAGDLGRQPVEFSWVGDTARRVGVCVHAQLQRWAADGAATLPDAAQVRRLLRREGVISRELEAATERVLLALRTTLADPRGRWLVATPHTDASCEFALTGQFDGRVQSIVIDRSFVDADGTRWVVDYKTSTHEGGDLEAFIANEARRYRPQLARYARFARELGPQPVRAALYFPLLGRFVEIDPDTAAADSPRD
jgi:ATP-dependent exoDNAse (exonuclease V) beta subunit